MDQFYPEDRQLGLWLRDYTTNIFNLQFEGVTMVFVSHPIIQPCQMLLKEEQKKMRHNVFTFVWNGVRQAVDWFGGKLVEPVIKMVMGEEAQELWVVERNSNGEKSERLVWKNGPQVGK